MLNKPLYRRLEVVFDKVRISNEGIKAAVRHFPDWSRGGKLKDNVSHQAEHYNVDCPFCGDQRKRLAIHYLYGALDCLTNSKRTGLAHCHNEDCLSNPDNRKKLFQMLNTSRSYTGTLPEVAKREERQLRITAPLIPLPTSKVRITSAKADAEAVEYLEERGFDIQELWDLWRVYYCERCTTCTPQLWHRLVYPIYFQPLRFEGDEPLVRIAGWQARRVGDDDGSQKYLFPSGFQKSLYLYGSTWAAQHAGPLVICEGVTDVWRLRNNAVALFGKTMSPQQRLAAQSLHWHGRDIAVFLDRDAKKEAELLAASIWKHLHYGCEYTPPRIEVVSLPRNRKDPAELSREEAWNCVAKAFGKSFRRLRVDLSADIKPMHPKSIVRRKTLPE